MNSVLALPTCRLPTHHCRLSPAVSASRSFAAACSTSLRRSRRSWRRDRTFQRGTPWCTRTRRTARTHNEVTRSPTCEAKSFAIARFLRRIMPRVSESRRVVDHQAGGLEFGRRLRQLELHGLEFGHRPCRIGGAPSRSRCVAPTRLLQTPIICAPMPMRPSFNVSMATLYPCPTCLTRSPRAPHSGPA